MPPAAGPSGKSLESTIKGQRPTTNAPTGSFHGAHHFAQHNPTFIHSIKLHQASQESAQAWPSVSLLTSALIGGRGTSDPNKVLCWIDGPAGVGKSSVGQLRGKLLGKANVFGAAVFFLAQMEEMTRADSLRPSRTDSQLIEQRIQKDPAVITLSMQNQFRELLERPLQVLGESHHLTTVEGSVIVIDGLDECNGTDGKRNAGETHRDIVYIIATSVYARGTPFRWMILSRSEPSIVAAFKDAQVSPITIHKPLRIPCEIDNEIEHVIKEELTRIGKESGLSSSWFWR
ncbi:hypothetical protein D9756_009176 [Leucocoprinus leucothites]|uniref:Nephrocystin 3-like N-terminal domain-containing protein n=1 Tax=Leucocoprinus leucothites TaxID=201217 RepID=A0A8H5CYA0_9AGAR|nr:hypothetical protein D9756_009176 [Leucoagaricus leucothites]